MNEFKGINEQGLEESIARLAESLMIASEHVNELSVTQSELDEMIAIFKGSYDFEEIVDSAEVVGMELDDISNGEVLYYLEEMIQCGLADEIEENVYYDIKLMNRCKKGELKWVKSKMIDGYDEKF